ncbi:MobF family relaxase [Acidithiobacillus sp. HP-2]|uniref:MobF family relaxase n=1 Tax=Acidithiobacillus sp. HP-2 TaxID=2697654 RepID=UPI0018793457|nr:MobF family relaxase [Acidithiobacillus sp. HP-2]MBE7570391.1 relaxase domain-containing protein [Acidithiobacillus sp. HP-2]
MSVKETHLKGTPESVIKYVSEQKEAQTVHFSEDETSNYYAENGNVKGVWMGNGAAIQGLSCYVNNSDLEKLLHGVTMDGHDISKRGNHQNNRRMGSDWTFSAPKAASILSIDDSRVKAWMLESVQQAIENFYAREMSHARKGKGGVITEFSDLIVAAGFLHETARAADGIIDPQLHVHVVIPNLIQRADGQWASLRSDYGKKKSQNLCTG